MPEEKKEPKITFKPTSDGNVEIFRDGKRVSTVASDTLTPEFFKSAVGTEAIGGFLDANDLEESPTTISNATVIEDVIPDMESRLTAISESGDFVDREGVPRDSTGAVIPEIDDDAKFLERLAVFNKQQGRAPTDATGVKKTEGGGIDTTGAFDEEGNVFNAIIQPQTQAEIEADEADREQDELTAEIKKNLDEQTRRQIESIEALYAVRRAQLKDINKRAAEAINQSLLIAGSSRFAPISSTGIAQARETASLLAISQLDAEEKSLINEARQAQIIGNFELLGIKLGLAETKRKEKLAEAKELNKIINEENEKLKERSIRVSRDSAMVDLFFGQEKTEFDDLFNALNFDEQGKKIGDFTVEEVKDFLDIVVTEQIKDKVNNQIVKLDNGQTILVNKNTGEIIKDLGGWTVNNTGGNRDDLSSFQILEARNLAIDIFGKRAGDKPENYGLIEDLMARGMTIDEIGDRLRFSGQSEQFSGEFKSAFEFVTKSGFTTSDRLASRDGLDELLEDGDMVGAREFVLGLARDKASADEKKNVVGREDLLIAIDSIEVGLKSLKDQGINTGFLAGLKEKALEKGGFAIGNAEQNAIANEIAIAIINYRRAISGAAFTESEAKAYEKVFPTTGRTTELNQTKINSIRKVANNAQDAFYRRSIGKSYDFIIGNEPEKPEIKEDTSLDSVQVGDIVEVNGIRYKAIEENGEIKFEEI